MEALFDLEDVGLDITPTIAMERGEQVVHQCAWCGAVVVWMHGGYRTELKDCPACDRNQGWWEQRLPVAGLVARGDSTTHSDEPSRCVKCGGPAPFHDPACIVHPGSTDSEDDRG